MGPVGRKWLFGVLSAGLAVVVLVMLRMYNPQETAYFPPCIFKRLTGLECPGCGAQRAVHFLLNGDFWAAFRQNPLLVTAIPYMGLGFYFDSSLFRRMKESRLKERMRRLRASLYGRGAIGVVFLIVVAYWVLRNLWDF